MGNIQDGVCHNWVIPGNYYVGAFLNYDKNNEKFHYTYTLTFFKFNYSTLAVTTDVFISKQCIRISILIKKVDIGIRCIHFPTTFFHVLNQVYCFSLILRNRHLFISRQQGQNPKMARKNRIVFSIKVEEV